MCACTPPVPCGALSRRAARGTSAQSAARAAGAPQRAASPLRTASLPPAVARDVRCQAKGACLPGSPPAQLVLTHPGRQHSEDEACAAARGTAGAHATATAVPLWWRCYGGTVRAVLQGAPPLALAHMPPALTRTPAQPYHAGTQAAETPARLLRTRFSAYCKGKADYVIATTHPDNDQLRSVTREAFAADVAATAKKGRFSKLEILAESAGLASDQAIVAFRYIVRCPADALSAMPADSRAAQFEIVGQKGFGARPSSRQQVTESSVFVRAEGEGPAAPWLFRSSELKADKVE